MDFEGKNIPFNAVLQFQVSVCMCVCTMPGGRGFETLYFLDIKGW